MKTYQIKVRENVYQELDSLRLGRESFGDIISRLIRTWKSVQRLTHPDSDPSPRIAEPRF